MATSDIEILLELIVEDPELMTELQDQCDRRKFAARVERLAIENGLAVRAEDVLETMIENRRRLTERWI